MYRRGEDKASPLSFDDPQGLQLRNLLADPCTVHHIHDVANILIGLRDLLIDGPLASTADINAPVFKLPDDRPASGDLLGLMPAEHSASPVASAAKGFLHRRLGAHKDIGAPTHVSGNQDGLTDLSVRLGDNQGVWGEGPGGPFSVNT